MKRTSDTIGASFSKLMRELKLPSTPFCILLGYSGGADSSSLLHLLKTNESSFDYTLYALHVNHMIRGTEADRDEAFCKKQCDDASIPIFTHKADVPALARKNKCGLEEAARAVRYAAFDRIAQEISEKEGKEVLIATAHNADDNAETILFNLTRGSSLAGLCGIKQRRDNIIRPLLLSSKSEILDYCNKNGIEYITDSTNLDTAYTRNKLRHLVLPTLREINPALSKTLGRTGARICDDNDYLQSVAASFIAENTADGKTPLDNLLALHPAIRSRVIYKLICEYGGTDCADTHVEAVERLCEHSKAHSSADLRGNICAAIEDGRLVFASSIKRGDTSFSSFSRIFDYGINVIEETGAVIARFYDTDTENIGKFKNIYKIFIQTHISSDKIKGTLLLRSKQAGDTCNINGVNRKLKKLLWEIEPDLVARERIALVCDDDGILWVPGARSRTGTYHKPSDITQTLFYVKPNNMKSTNERIGSKNA